MIYHTVNPHSIVRYDKSLATLPAFGNLRYGGFGQSLDNE